MVQNSFKQSLLQWRFVSAEQLHEKFFRYFLFKQKWLSITSNSELTAQILAAWVEDSKTGKDIVVSLIEFLDNITDPDIYLELLEASDVISKGDFTGLSEKEIEFANHLALSLLKSSLLDEFQYTIQELQDN